MLRTFDIAVPPESRTVQADAQGRAAVAYTITNNKPSPARGRVRIVPRSSSKEDWFGVDGEGERDFRGNEAHQFTVRALIPPQTLAGTYSFRLDAANVANPQEDFSEGETVAVEWKPLPPQQERQWPSWLIPVIAALAVLIVGGVVWYIVSQMASEEPKPERFVLKPSKQPTDLQEGVQERPRGIVFAANGRWLAIAGHNEVRLRELEPDRLDRPSIRLPGSREKILVASGRDPWLFTSGGSESGQLWDLGRTDLIPRQIGFSDEGNIVDAAFSPDGKWFAIVGSLSAAEEGMTGQATLWNLQSPAAPKTWKLNTAPRCLAFSSDSRQLVTAGEGKPPQLWNPEAPLADEQPAASEIGAGQEWNNLSASLIHFTGDGRWLVVGISPLSDEDHDAVHKVSLRCWRLDAGLPTSMFTIRDTGIDPFFETSFLASSSDGRWLSAGTASKPAYLWDLKAAPDPPRRELPADSGTIACAAFDMDSHWLAAGSRDKVLLFDLSRTEPLGSPEALSTPGTAHAVAFSGDRRWLAAACKHTQQGEEPPANPTESPDPVIRLWALEKVAIEDGDSR